MKEFPAALHRLSERTEQSDAAEHEHGGGGGGGGGGIVFDVRGEQRLQTPVFKIYANFKTDVTNMTLNDIHVSQT